MPRFGKCKTCWWWNQVGENKGICWMQTHYDDDPHYSDSNSYCPDHNPRRDANKRGGTLKQWLEEGGHKYIIYKKLY
jgi:hypothetical protein